MLLTVDVTYSVCVCACVYMWWGGGTFVCGAGGPDAKDDILFYLSIMFTMVTLLAVSNDPS